MRLSDSFRSVNDGMLKQRKKTTSTYVAMQRGVRSLHGDVASSFISSFNGAVDP